MREHNPTSPPSHAATTAALAAQQLLALAEENALLREQVAALMAERTQRGVLVQPVQRLAYTMAETAAALGTSKDRIRELLHSSSLDGFQDGQVWFIPIASIERWLEHHGQPTSITAPRKGATR